MIGAPVVVAKQIPYRQHFQDSPRLPYNHTRDIPLLWETWLHPLRKVSVGRGGLVGFVYFDERTDP